MDRIKEFDKLYGETDREWVLADTLTNCILLPLMLLIYMIPVNEFKGGIISSCIFYFMVVKLKLARYMQVEEKGKMVSVYTKMRYIPVEPKDIFRVRLQYLWSYCRKYTLWALIARVAGCVLFKEHSVLNLVNVFCHGALVYGIFYLDLLPKKEKRR